MAFVTPVVWHWLEKDIALWINNQDNQPKTPDTDDVDRTAQKRKIDKDGFVHPATPDIPKTSMQYSLPSFPAAIDMNFSSAQAILEENQDGVGESESPLDQNQNESSQLSEQLCELTTAATHKQTEQTGGDTAGEMSSDDNHLASLTPHQLDPAPSSHFTTGHDDSGSTAMTPSREAESLTTMEDLFKELSQEAKMVTQQFSSGFVQSEQYEAFCLTRLDQLISHAHELEQAYIKQKEVLRQRLRVISHTLQNM